jgi:hypothetical protein
MSVSQPEAGVVAAAVAATATAEGDRPDGGDKEPSGSRNGDISDLPVR